MSTYGIWLSAAGMQVNEHRQTLLANNMANANTAGFKQDMAIVRERNLQTQENSEGFRFAHAVLDGYSGRLLRYEDPEREGWVEDALILIGRDDLLYFLVAARHSTAEPGLPVEAFFESFHLD